MVDLSLLSLIFLFRAMKIHDFSDNAAQKLVWNRGSPGIVGLVCGAVTRL